MASSTGSDTRLSSGAADVPPRTAPTPCTVVSTPRNDALWCKPTVTTEKNADSLKPTVRTLNPSASMIVRSTGSPQMNQNPAAMPP